MMETFWQDLRYSLRRSMKPALAMLMAVVALVLLIACANEEIEE